MKPYPLNLHRFDEVIAEMETRENTPSKILLYGSSFFTNWKEATAQMLERASPLKPIVPILYKSSMEESLLVAWRRKAVST